MKKFSRTTATLICLALFTAEVADAKDTRVEQAIKRGTDFVKSKQDRRDGFYKDKWFGAYPSGETALSLLTLLKAGEDPQSAPIKAGFKALFRAPIKKIYSVSIGILAVEARYSPTALQLSGTPSPYKSVARKKFRKKASPKDRKWLIAATNFLIKTQKQNGLWNYPFGGEDDVSNTQFALLALKSSKRLGLKVPDEIWGHSLKYLVSKQQNTGDKVTPFKVPAADGRLNNKKSKENWAETVERIDMFARGWGYKPGQGPRGSMTAAAVACLVVIKSELESKKTYQRRYSAQVDKAIRDGSAWIGQQFQSDKNPGAELDWLFYYLYTLERAGTLTGCTQFGKHNWYQRGRDAILRRQKGDGAFQQDTAGEVDGKLAGTCLAILFLKRSTVPILERVATGSVKIANSTEQRPQVKKLADGRYQVTFIFEHEEQARINVAGSFNSWSKDQSTLVNENGGKIYKVTLTLTPGRHEYKFVINGQHWVSDPKNSKSNTDKEGNTNSLLELQ
jgi:hypothetical protein